MFCLFFARRGFSKAAGIGVFVSLTLSAHGAAPTISGIDPSTAPAGRTVVPVNITGTGFQNNNAGNVTVNVDSTSVTVERVQVNSDTSLNATFILAADTAGMVNVTVTTATGGLSTAFPWDTGRATECIEAIPSQGCVWRWTVDVSGVSNPDAQTKTNTAPNILTSLNYEYQIHQTPLPPRAPRSPANPATQTNPATQKDKQKTPKTMLMQGVFSAGYTQVANAAKVTTSPNSTNGSSTPTLNAMLSMPSTSSGATAGCPTSPSTSSSTSSSMPSTCNAAVPQQAFVADIRGHFGWVMGQDGTGGGGNVYSELGVGVRGSLQALTQSNQVVQSGGLSYVSLNSLNPRSVTALYEGTLRFRVVQHDKAIQTMSMKNGQPQMVNKDQNSSNLLVFEVGYQNNSGMAQLALNPQTNTRNRIVGRFYLSPELPGGTHTKGVVGLEYSGGISGGPAVVQIFWGTNLNPSKLINPSKSN